MEEVKRPKRPGARPTCRHGVGVGGTYGCEECSAEDSIVAARVKPLADEWWDSKGDRDLNHQLLRAYYMGMKHDPTEG